MPKLTIVTVRVTTLNAITENGERVFATIGNIAQSPVKGGGDLIKVVDNDLTKTLSVGQELFAPIICANKIPGKDSIAKLLCYPMKEEDKVILPLPPKFEEEVINDDEDYEFASSYSKHHGKDKVKYNTRECGKTRSPKCYKEKGGAKNRLAWF